VATLSVLKFTTPTGAEAALGTVEELSKGELITLHDAAIASWPENKRKPKVRQLNDMKGVGALSGSFWGLLFGMLFFVPVLGMAVGAAMGAASGSLVDAGIDDRFIDSVRSKVTRGSSALFLLTSDAVQDKVVEAMKQHDFELLTTNLSSEDEAKLRAAFDEDDDEEEG
jgi:uncharacterized membrane protein